MALTFRDTDQAIQALVSIATTMFATNRKSIGFKPQL